MCPPLLRAALLLLVLVVCVRGAAPNIVLIVADDLGWSQLSETMDPRVPDARSAYLETPTLARLMREGIRFTSGYAPAPLCTPTRRSILCGTSAPRSGTEFRSPWVPAQHLTIPKALKEADASYRCAHFGKWGEQMISTPEQCGYDASDGMTGNDTGGMPATLGVKGGHKASPNHFIDNDDPKLTRSVTDKSIAFMSEQAKAGRPFFVQASYYAVHLSVVCRAETLKKYEAKGAPDRGYTPAWAAMLEELDGGVGRLLDALEKLGVKENTYVFFTADNGGRPTVPGGSRIDTNIPLDGSKHTLWEGGIRVPFIARGPGVPAGSVCHVPVAGYDFLPTFRELAGGPPLQNPELDGASFAALLRNPAGQLAEPGRALFFHYPSKGQSVIRQGPDKLMLTRAPNGSLSRLLFRVDPDPRENNRDLAASEPARADELQQRLLAHLKAVGASDDAPKKRGKRREK